MILLIFKAPSSIGQHTAKGASRKGPRFKYIRKCQDNLRKFFVQHRFSGRSGGLQNSKLKRTRRSKEALLKRTMWGYSRTMCCSSCPWPLIEGMNLECNELDDVALVALSAGIRMSPHLRRLNLARWSQIHVLHADSPEQPMLGWGDGWRSNIMHPHRVSGLSSQMSLHAPLVM